MAALNRRIAALHAFRRIHTRVMAENYNPDRVMIETELETIEQNRTRFNSAHDELISNATNEEELEAHLSLEETADAIRINSVARLRRLLEFLELDPSVRSDGPDAPPAPAPAAGNLALDRLTLPRFDGQIHNWLAFQDTFVALVHSQPYQDAYKLGKLRECVDAEAVPLMKTIFTGGYQAAWETLQKRYNSKRKQAEAHVHRLLEIQPLVDDAPEGLLHIVDMVKGTIDALRVLELPVDEWDGFLVPFVTRLLPPSVYEQWTITLSDEGCPPLAPLLRLMEQRIHRRPEVTFLPPATDSKVRFAVNTRGRTVPPTNMYRSPQKQRFTSHVARDAAPPQQDDPAPTSGCQKCRRAHRLQQCPEFKTYTVAQRCTWVQKNRICFNCLWPNHDAHSCPSRWSCSRCGKRHHSLLCQRTGSKQPSNELPPDATPREQMNSGGQPVVPPGKNSA